MKITDYPSVVNLVENNVFLIDGPEGTKQITAKDLAGALCYILGSDGYYEFLDGILPVEERRMTFRGKNLGPSLTREQAQHIANGDFKGFYIGDYWTDDVTNWRIVDINYWLGTGNSPVCQTPHLVIMPDKILYTGVINQDAGNVKGSYLGSEMYKTGLNRAKEMVNSFFGENNVLNHKEYLSNSTTDGYPSGSAWVESTVELPNEIMMYGTVVSSAIGNCATVFPHVHTIDKTQLALMKIHPKWICPHRQSQWLRDVAATTSFSSVGNEGVAARAAVTNLYGVRPVFGITGEGLAAS